MTSKLLYLTDIIFDGYGASARGALPAHLYDAAKFRSVDYSSPPEHIVPLKSIYQNGIHAILDCHDADGKHFMLQTEGFYPVLKIHLAHPTDAASNIDILCRELKLKYRPSFTVHKACHACNLEIDPATQQRKVHLYQFVEFRSAYLLQQAKRLPDLQPRIVEDFESLDQQFLEKTDMSYCTYFEIPLAAFKPLKHRQTHIANEYLIHINDIRARPDIETIPNILVCSIDIETICPSGQYDVDDPAQSVIIVCLDFQRLCAKKSHKRICLAIVDKTVKRFNSQLFSARLQHWKDNYRPYSQEHNLRNDAFFQISEYLDPELTEFRHFRTEAELLCNLRDELVLQSQPGILVGYNLSFDLPYLHHRANLPASNTNTLLKNYSLLIGHQPGLSYLNIKDLIIEKQIIADRPSSAPSSRSSSRSSFASFPKTNPSSSHDKNPADADADADADDRDSDADDSDADDSDDDRYEQRLLSHRKESKNKFIIGGMEIHDSYLFALADHSDQPSFKLNDIAHALLKKKKIAIDRNSMNESFVYYTNLMAQNSPEGYDEYLLYLAYCMLDSILAKEINLNYSKTINLSCYAKLCYTSMMRMHYGGASCKTQNMVLHYIHTKFLNGPDKIPGIWNQKEYPTYSSKYKGANVLDCKAGYYPGNICVFDVNSLYPSVIIFLSLCFSSLVPPPGLPPLPLPPASTKPLSPNPSASPSTLLPAAPSSSAASRRKADQRRKAAEQHSTDIKQFIKHRRVSFESTETTGAQEATSLAPFAPLPPPLLPPLPQTPKEGFDIVDDHLVNGTPVRVSQLNFANGTQHIFANDPRFPTILPALEDWLLRERRLLVAELGKLKKKPDKTDDDLQKIVIIDGKQKALKLVANSIYGVMGAQYGNVRCRAVAECVTLGGRSVLERLINIVQTWTKYRCEIIYGDTDSVFVLIHDELSNTDLFAAANELSHMLSTEVSQYIGVKLEAVYRGALLHKKTYIVWSFESPGDVGKLKISGFNGSKRQSPLFTRTIVSKLGNALVGHPQPNYTKCLEYVVATCNLITTGTLSDTDLIVAKKLKALYLKQIPAHAFVAKTLREAHWTEQYKTGDRVPYIIYNTGKKDLSQRAYDPKYAQHLKLKVDWIYYMEAFEKVVQNMLHLFPDCDKKQEIFAVLSKTLASLHNRKVSQISDFFSRPPKNPAA